MRDAGTTTPPRLIGMRLRAGVWEGVLDVGHGGAAPGIEVLHLGERLDGVTVTPDPDAPGRYAVAVPIPAEMLSDGLQTFVIRDAGRGETLSSLAVLAGAPLEEDLRAEIALLRAELELLQRAFRRHCRETT